MSNDPARAQATPASARELFVAFCLLAMQGFGGVLAVAQRTLCEQRRWLTREQFVELLAISQVLPAPNVCNLAVLVGDRYFGWRGALAAPGANVLFVAVLGYQAAGLAGALTTLTAMMLPSTTLALAAGRWGHAQRERLAVRAFKAGMAPVAIALIAATAWILSTETPGRVHLAVKAVAALLVWRTRVHLLWLIAAGAAIGAPGWV